MHQLQALYRTILKDCDPVTEGRLKQRLDGEIDHKFAWAFLRFLVEVTEWADKSTDVATNLRSLGLKITEERMELCTRRFLPSPLINQDLTFIAAPTVAKEIALHPLIAQTVKCLNHYFFHTSSGLLDLGHSGVQAGDSICVLDGCKVPTALRQGDGRYILVGECFVLGLMDGEAAERVSNRQARIEKFELH
jgi:hypothetical protein